MQGLEERRANVERDKQTLALQTPTVLPLISCFCATTLSATGGTNQTTSLRKLFFHNTQANIHTRKEHCHQQSCARNNRVHSSTAHLSYPGKSQSRSHARFRSFCLLQHGRQRQPPACLRMTDLVQGSSAPLITTMSVSSPYTLKYSFRSLSEVSEDRPPTKILLPPAAASGTAARAELGTATMLNVTHHMSLVPKSSIHALSRWGQSHYSICTAMDCAPQGATGPVIGLTGRPALSPLWYTGCAGIGPCHTLRIPAHPHPSHVFVLRIPVRRIYVQASRMQALAGAHATKRHPGV